MKKMYNRVSLQGYLYDHKLSQKVSGDGSKNPGTPFITGTIDVATNKELTNIVSVHFTYVTATYGSSGKTNRNYGILTDIINGKLKTVMSKGVDEAAKISVDATVDVNDFYTKHEDKEELVSAKRNEGSFISVLSSLNYDDPEKVNSFNVDMLINGTRLIEADEERNLPEKLIIKGCVFDFRGAIKPVEFSVLNPAAISYFQDTLAPSTKEPVLTRVRGTQVSEVSVTKIEEENAFGEPYVREVIRSRKDWVITWSAKETYLWDDETTITAEELSKAIADRNVYLATVKQRYDEYTNGATQAAPSNGGFNF